MSGRSSLQGGTPQGGVGNDRHDWIRGESDVITLDSNADNQGPYPFIACRQRRAPAARPGSTVLINRTDNNGAGNYFAFHGNVMVWSAGPDGKVDPTSGANNGVNKDKHLSWE